MRNSNSGSFKIESESENSQIINSKENNFIEQNFEEIINSNENEEKLDNEPYDLIELEEEFYYEFTIPKRETIPNLGKYF